MEENERRSNSGQGFSIAGLILGIIALILSVIPCSSFGIMAIVLGIVAIVFSALSLIQARRANVAKGIATAALIVSIVATLAGFTFYMRGQGVRSHTSKEVEKSEWSKELDETIDQLNEDGTFDDMENTLNELESDDSTQDLNKAIDKELKEKEVEKE